MLTHRFMREAIRLARRAVRDGTGGPFGAVIVRRGKIIARSQNTVLAANDPTAHAEVNAIRAACERLGRFRLDDCELYTSCEPCPMCLAAIQWARLRRVHYAATRHDAARAGFDDARFYRQVTVPMRRMLRAEALPAFTAWKQKPDKTLY
jgi:tRNA(Arg) A34 adenosine deaminase TadA